MSPDVATCPLGEESPLLITTGPGDQTGLNLGLSQGEPRGVLMALVSYGDRLHAVALFLNIDAANLVNGRRVQCGSQTKGGKIHNEGSRESVQ